MTPRQDLGAFGEELVRKTQSCPRCKRSRVLRRLPPNFKCADIICDFCGYLAQVKTATTPDVDALPRSLLGAAWMPQKERMEAGIFFPLFIVLVTPDRRRRAVYYLPADLQTPEMFTPRTPLRETARRAGWQGYMIRIDLLGQARPVRVA
jgi:type II restriction enzyme